MQGRGLHSMVSIRLLLFFLLSSLLAGCSVQKPVISVAEHYSKAKYKKVGVLVNRMGNIEFGFPVPITLEMDYANRVPCISGYGSEIPDVNVYIEDEDRLRESIPDYPEYKPISRFEYMQYYKNITPQIYDNVTNILSGKGYSLIDVKAMAIGWPQPVSEMTVQAIVERLRGTVDILFVLHYMDRGPFKWDDIRSQKEASGFVGLVYTVSMFDTQTLERVLLVESESIAPYEAIIGDPSLRADPEISKKIQQTKANNFTGRGLYRTWGSVTLAMSEDEIIDLVMNYMRYGLVYDHFYDISAWVKTTINGLEEIIP